MRAHEILTEEQLNELDWRKGLNCLTFSDLMTALLNSSWAVAILSASPVYKASLYLRLASSRSFSDATCMVLINVDSPVVSFSFNLAFSSAICFA